MGRKKINSYILEWFIGDHEPKHVHVFSSKGQFIGRLNIKKMAGIEGWMPDIQSILSPWREVAQGSSLSEKGREKSDSSETVTIKLKTHEDDSGFRENLKISFESFVPLREINVLSYFKI